MVRDRATGSLIGLFILFMIACAVAQEETPQLNTDEINNKINNAHKLYRQAKFEDAVISTSSLLAGQDLTTEQESEALLVLAMSEANRGQDKEAKTYLERLADIDPGVDLNPDEYPPQMMRIWYAVEQNIPEEKRKTPVGQRSVAVLPFDNTSISKDQKDLDPLSKGLASMMIQDIVKTGQLKVVERDRINFLVDELKLQLRSIR